MERFIPLICALVLGGVASQTFAEPAPFVVHEWGVMVRSATNHGTELAPPEEASAELPDFVLRHDHIYQPRSLQREWDKPIVHLYGPPGLKVEVRVVTGYGRPLVYWPMPKLLEETFWSMGSGVTDAVGMEWTGTLATDPPADLRPLAAESWWSEVRRVPSMYFQSAIASAGSERFLFYEATALQEPAISATLTPEAIVISNSFAQESGTVLVLVNDGRQIDLARVPSVPGGGNVQLTREAIMAHPLGAAQALEGCRAQWVGFGLTSEEAAAVVRTWSKDLTGSRGFLLISRLPAPLYERIFPIVVTPPPDRMVRVGMVLDTIAGQPARLDWLPALRPELERWGKELGDEDFSRRAAAERRFAHLGDLAQPVLESLRDSTNPEVRARALTLLARLKPVETAQLPVHGPGSTPKLVHRTWRDVATQPQQKQ